MRKELKFTFKTKKGELNLGTDTQWGIINYEGLEATDYDYESRNRMNGIGATKTGFRRQTRTITIEFETRRRQHMADKEHDRKQLIEFFNPLLGGELIILRSGTTRYINYDVSSFELIDKNLSDKTHGTIELTCWDPDLRAAGKTQEISTFIGGWQLPFKLPVKFKEKSGTAAIIENEGSLSTPLIVEFAGPAENPSITNEETGEMIKVNSSIYEGDVLEIGTQNGNIKVLIHRSDGTEEDAFNQIDYSSQFMQLLPGVNLIRYDTENDSAPQSVYITYEERYLGI